MSKAIKAYICNSHEHGCSCIEEGTCASYCPIQNKGKVTNGYFIDASTYRKQMAVIRAVDNYIQIRKQLLGKLTSAELTLEIRLNQYKLDKKESK